jgi:alkyl hydroperoxide reductase subunit AhpF
MLIPCLNFTIWLQGIDGISLLDTPSLGLRAREPESMAESALYDVIVVGGGIAGSCMGGLLARSGLGVLVLEKEAAFPTVSEVKGRGPGV